MNDDLHVMAITKTNFQYFCDIEVIIGFTCIMPLLKVVQVFIMFVQACDTFECDFVTTITMYI